MARIIFIQDSLFEYQGIQALSARLKAGKHEVSLEILTETGRSGIIEAVRKKVPDIVAFSVTSNNYIWAVELNARIKESVQVLSVFGGPHPTYFPELIDTAGIDVICRGEGEEPLTELCDALDQKKDIRRILNLWVKDASGAVHRNGLRPLIRDLDSMPFSDRELYYDKYPLLRGLSNKRFPIQRGCPYSCSFCFNHSYREMCKNGGKFVRFRSAPNIIRELEEVRARYHLKSVSFNADSFTLHPQFTELLALYREKIKLPFFCNARFNELDEEKIVRLKEAGCYCLAIGVESGSERIRNGILHREMSNKVIIDNARLLKKHNLPFNAYVMMGIPTETLDEALKTVEFLAAIGSYKIMPTMYQPLIGTDLWNLMKEQGLFDESVAKSTAYGNDSAVKLRDKQAILNLHKLSYLAVRFPRTLPLIKRLIKLPYNPLFQLFFNYGTFDSIRSSRGMNFLEMLRISLKLRNSV